jgi:hypothetical protein
VVEDHVRAALCGDLEHAAGEVLVLVQDRVIGAECPACRRLVLVANAKALAKLESG